MQTRYTFHLIPNAHIDPVWLWDWREGLNEGLVTCRTILDLMDEDRALTFIRGESFIYEHIEKTDPATFAQDQKVRQAKTLGPRRRDRHPARYQSPRHRDLRPPSSAWPALSRLALRQAVARRVGGGFLRALRRPSGNPRRRRHRILRLHPSVSQYRTPRQARVLVGLALGQAPPRLPRPRRLVRLRTSGNAQAPRRVSQSRPPVRPE